MEYLFEKKQAEEKARYEKMMALAEAEKKRQQIIIWFVTVSLILILAFLGVTFYSLQVTKKQKRIIEEAKDEIARQKEEVERQNVIIKRQKEEVEEQKRLVEEKTRKSPTVFCMLEEFRMPFYPIRTYGKNFYRIVLCYIYPKTS